VLVKERFKKFCKFVGLTLLIGSIACLMITVSPTDPYLIPKLFAYPLNIVVLGLCFSPGLVWLGYRL
jgi:hypothetical protein